ncbi:hypothetical protein SteCoe_19215 [Stentor coeruleus]|uniref:Uncharacterized protein n=1 Tax=Stentor coeruleus TaxID=5963 RepID=A0A1R2BUL7_9CILI|nr:hypothetical protein SteCoe_19215 [Stentor coeruleus]
MKAISLKNYSDTEQFNIVNTPRSLEACFCEGIQPDELLYAPFEDFARPGLSKAIQQMNYKFFETQRKKLLTLARNQYNKILNSQKQSHSQADLKIKKIVDNEIQKLKENNLKRISKLINYKLDGLKITSENDPSYDDAKPNAGSQKAESPSNHNPKRTQSSSGFNKSQSSHYKNDKKPDYKKDEIMLAQERERQEKNELKEKAKNEEIEKLRKIKEKELQDHINRVKILREKENHDKLAKLAKRESNSKKQLERILRSEASKRNEKITQEQSRVARVLSLKAQVDDYYKVVRDKIVKEENDKLALYTSRKLQYQNEVQEKTHSRNVHHEEKSKITREKYIKELEEKKDKLMQELKKREEKLNSYAYKKEQEAEILKQKNKLKDVEKEWNTQRVIRKEEFKRNELLKSLSTGFNRAEAIKSAREFMRQARYDLVIQSKTQKDRINKAIYKMEVKKKMDVDEIKEILSEQGIGVKQPLLKEFI